MSLLKFIRTLLSKDSSKIHHDTISLPPSYDDIEPPSYFDTIGDISSKIPEHDSKIHEHDSKSLNDELKIIVDNIRNKKYNLGGYIFDNHKSVSKFIKYIIKNNCSDIVVYALYSNNKIMIGNNNYNNKYNNSIIFIATDKNQTVRIGNEFINKCKGNTEKAILIVARYLDNNNKSICTNYIEAFNRDSIRKQVKLLTSN